MLEARFIFSGCFHIRCVFADQAVLTEFLGAWDHGHSDPREPDSAVSGRAGPG